MAAEPCLGPRSGARSRSGPGRWGKRKIVSVAEGDSSTYKKIRSDFTMPKLPVNGYPSEHPFNKDGFKYILAEPDAHGPFRQEFDESLDWAGKPIPGWLFRKLNSHSVLVAMHDRAPQLKVSEDRLSVTGEKGYCMTRATHGVHHGTWYYEVKITDMPEGGATRLGWCQDMGNLQGPCGYDKFGYSWRSRHGTKFHDSKGIHFAASGYRQGDIIGILINLPEDPAKRETAECLVNRSNHLPPTFKEKPLVRFKSFLYFEDKEEPQKAVKQLKPLPGSSISFYKNGKCVGTAFENIYAGVYYPAASFYKSVTVTFNFGPNFAHPPDNVAFRGINEMAHDAAIQQTVADLVYFTENDGKLRLDTFYYGLQP